MGKIYKPLLIDRIKGRKLDSKIDQLIANQRLSPEKLKEYQNNKLNKIIKHAIETVPYYKNKYGPYKNGTVINDIEPLTKDIVQKMPVDFLSSAFVFNELRSAKTSGSTGKPLVFYFDDNLRAWNRAATARALSWWGVKYGSRCLRVWGLPNANIAAFKMRLIYLVNNIICKNVFKLSNNEVVKFIKTQKYYRPSYVYGYTSGIYEMVNIINNNKLTKDLKNIKLVITTSEMLHDYQRASIKHGFDCNVTQEYGVGEVGIVGFECPRGKLHSYDDLMYVELDENGVCYITSLVNEAMPLIRYNTGDVVELSDEQCICGLPFKVISKLKGRTSAVIKYNGKVLHSEIFDYIAREFVNDNYRAIVDFRVTRKKDDELQYDIIPGKDYDKSVVFNKIVEFTKTTFGVTMQATIKIVDKLPRTPVGKIQFYVDERI